MAPMRVWFTSPFTIFCIAGGRGNNHEQESHPTEIECAGAIGAEKDLQRQPAPTPGRIGQAAAALHRTN